MVDQHSPLPPASIWAPDADFLRVFQLQVPQFSDPIGDRYRSATKEIRTRQARTDVDGGPVLLRLTHAACAALDDFAGALTSNGLALIHELNGGYPPGSTAWMRARFNERVTSFRAGPEKTIDLAAVRFRVDFTRQARQAFGKIVDRRQRELELALSKIEITGAFKRIASSSPSRSGSAEIDAFISYASEDRTQVAEPLAAALAERSFNVWYAANELKVGMNLFSEIDLALSRSRFGIVILSPAFFAKTWPRRELSALAGLAESTNSVLPIWHNLTSETVRQYSPLMAAVVALETLGLTL